MDGGRKEGYLTYEESLDTNNHGFYGGVDAYYGTANNKSFVGYNGFADHYYYPNSTDFINDMSK